MAATQARPTPAAISAAADDDLGNEMISRNLSRRLEHLEERMLSPADRVVLRIVFVNTDGTVAPGGSRWIRGPRSRIVKLEARGRQSRRRVVDDNDAMKALQRGFA